MRFWERMRMVSKAVLNAAPENEVQTMKVLIVCEESWEEQNNDIS